MAKVLKYSVLATVVLGMIVLGIALSSGVAMAQDDASTQGVGPDDASKQAVGPGHKAEDPGARAETAQTFDSYLRKNPEVRQEVMKDPSLLNNPDYLAKHPGVQKFMNQHPDFARAVKKNPDRMMHKSAREEKRTVRQHEHNSRPVNSRPVKN